MKNRIAFIAFLSWFLFVQNGIGQDTSHVFSREDFIEIVKKHHPIAYQADLQTEKAQAIVQRSKGNFDPKLYGKANQKYFDGKNYYSHLNSGLIIPTWFGLTVQGGYSNNSGDRLNPELYTPANVGLWHAGITANLGKGLLIDQRRAELQQAQIYQNATLIEQRLMMNQLVYDASMAYADWFKAYHTVQIYEGAVANALIRLDGIRASHLMGDLPAYDTLKALILVQDRQLKLEQSYLQLTNKKLQLEVFLWEEGFIPLELDSLVIPDLYSQVPLEIPSIRLIENLDTLTANHPEILRSNNGIDLAKIDFRMKKEALKPTIELKYNALSSTSDGGLIETYSLNNYNWGAQVSYPIFTRKERADVKISELKLMEEMAKLEDKTAQIKAKIETTFNVWLSTTKQVEIYRDMVNNYKLLFEAELTLFNIGESSLFVVNERDRAMLDAEIKLVDLIYQNHASNAVFDYFIFNY